ncbi:beta-galactosidase 11 [Brachypodium distachyon]|uniref:Beta-galactosidase n=1 Tax=Brachypodium distachyon TaxID=15368 RepID=I1I9A2_BRADI|nr:beta-galactosidase 11 [Brachypodium distachyon]PNT68547.1 hypothetical protein BRADI_3g42330v3 [Brachypodium distachyon]|eukprot:XP_014755852.1 beta-galactosidase 11 [Brachypodium distachyon]
MSLLRLLLFFFFFLAAGGGGNGGIGKCEAYGLTKEGTAITFDRRSLMVDGRRDLFFSGSIHYPRSPPHMWPDLIARAKEGGLNVIESYVFWNGHEPEMGVYNFEGRYDMIKFFKLVQEHEMFAMVRIGPFVQAEWNHGGLPYWLREVPDIIFRTNNEPFKKHMQKFVTMIVNKLKDAKLFASQGGPIILAQIENEYQHLEAAFKENGTTYIHWAAKMASDLNIGVPWIMCKQTKAPGEVIPTCNGRHCGDTWPGPTDKNKPLLWTENWTAQYRVFGDPPSQRSAEDIAFAVARFYSVGGTMVNYYMYHGGTNFGRTGASFVMPRYYDEAPLDEFGLYKEPKWGHLRDLHHALRLCKKAILWGNPSNQPLGKLYEARLFEIPEQKICVAFLSNHNTKEDGTVTFRGQQYFVPRRSVSILADCKTVVFSTQHVNSQHNQRTFHFSDQTVQGNVWEMYTESDKVPTYKFTNIRTQKPLEAYNLTKDKTDYVWYTTSFKLEAEDLPFRKDIWPVLEVSSHGHAMVAFVNGKYVGAGHGTKINKAFTMEKPIEVRTGINHVSILSTTLGMQDSGVYLEHRQAGIDGVTIQGLNTGTLDLTSNGWGHLVGLEGERRNAHTEKGGDGVQWVPAVFDRPLTWYRRRFDIPTGDDPVVIDMSPMGKGVLYVNGEGLGRYWSSYKHALGRPSQYLYHVPRCFLKPTGNVMTIFEEEGGGQPDGIMILTVKRDNICSFISEKNPAHVKSWERKDSHLKSVADADLKPQAVLSCPEKKLIQQVVFASYGNPLGICGNYTVGNCHAPKAKEIVEKACVGKKSCVLQVSHEVYGADLNCPGSTGTLAVQAKCSKRQKAADQ